MTRHLITSALPYINGVKHLGNLVGSHAAGRRLRPLPARRAATRCCSSAPPTSTAPRPSWPPRRPGSPVADFCAQQHEVQKDVGERLRPVLGPLRPQLVAAEPRAHPALRRAGSTRDGLPRGARRPSRCTRPPTAASCPTATSSAPARTAATTSARGDQCENCTRVLDPTDLIEPRSAISGSTDLEVRETKHLFLLQSKLADEVRGVGRGARRRLAAAHAFDRPQVARRGPAGPRHHPRPRLGRAGRSTGPGLRGQGLLRLVRRPDRVHRRHRRSGPTLDPATPRLASLVVRRRRRRATRSSWARTTCRSTRCRSRPRCSAPASRGSWSTTSRASTGSTTTAASSPPSQGRGVFMDQALEILPGRLLALVPDRQRARVERLELHLGAASPSRSTRTSPTPSATSSTAASRCRPSTTARSCPRAATPGEREAQLDADLARGRRAPTPT